MSRLIGVLGLLVVSTARAEPPPTLPIGPPAVLSPSAPTPPIVWSGTLGGGVPVALVERHGLPLVRVELSFDITMLEVSAGALDALGGVWGEGLASGDTRDTLEKVGADVSLGCGAVRCWAVLEVPVEGLAEALALSARVVREPMLRSVGIARWRRDARREWSTDWLGPGIVHARALGRLTWPDGHPYRLDRSTAADLQMHRADVRDAWRRVTGEAAASIVVAGDVVPAAVLPLLEAAYGGLGGGASAAEVGPPSAPAGRHVLVNAPGANQAIVSVAWAGPTRMSADYGAYTLAFQALAGGFTSRLNLRLREDEGLTYRVDGAYSAEAGYGWGQIELAVDPLRVGAVLAILTEELERARTEGFTEAEIGAARHQLWLQAAVETSTLAGLARVSWRERRAGMTPGASVTHLAMLQDVSVGQVAAAAATWLAQPRTWLVSGDGDTLEPALEQADWPTDVVWGACQAVYGGRCPPRGD
ncbi:MAG: insulinase family protein [Pseudomonadota bacterium]|nr:insulinase family protein [Pseudomonadota bacterium]